ncbi:MAG: hypothetical protein J0I84_11595 [Terrimonas sp.]|nr:hypothetical protein [Terrimonas sp.]
MRHIFLYFLTLTMFTGCKKEEQGSGPRIDIYLLKSFTTMVDKSTMPATISITDVVLDDIPLVSDQDIKVYVKATTTFVLSKDIQTVIQHYSSDKAFAITVDNQPVYYGVFHPLYLSSITFGLATISPLLLNNNELRIDFPTIEGNSFLQQLDNRNDSRIINALKTTNRLR